MRAEEGVDGADGRRLEGAVRICVDGGAGTADADRRRAAAREARIGIPTRRWRVEIFGGTAELVGPHSASLYYTTLVMPITCSQFS